MRTLTAHPLPPDMPVLTPTRPELKVGRGSDNDIVLRQGTVSRHHALVHREGDAWIVEDTGSTNGTAINGVRVNRPTEIERGDLVMFGAAMLLFEPDG